MEEVTWRKKQATVLSSGPQLRGRQAVQSSLESAFRDATYGVWGAGDPQLALPVQRRVGNKYS